MLCQYSSIKPQGNEYQAIRSNDINDIMDDTDIINAVEYPVYELGVDDLPEGIEDITGKIHNEPERIFAYQENGCIVYFGLDEVFEA